jgi:predicted amidohydrolase YtcJ
MTASGLFTGAKVFTGSGEDDFASAFRVEDGVFTWVGDERAVAGSRSTDLGGRTVLPGLLDMHTHPAVMAARGDAVDCNPPTVTSLAGLLDALRGHPAIGAGPQEWIVGSGFDDARYPEGRPPTACDLDTVSATQPVFVWRCDGHSASCNTRALEIAGVAAETPDPPGARFERDAAGNPTGVLTEHAAARAVADVIPVPDAAGFARRIADLDVQFLSHGITGVCDLLSTYAPDPLATFRAARELGFHPRAALYLGWTPDLADLAEGDLDGDVRVAGIKVFVDGAFSNRTAWVDEPYPDSVDHGIRSITDDDLRAAADWARRNRAQLAIHAMGDRALNRVVDVLGDQRPWLDGVPSVRLEHATLVAPALLQRLLSAPMSFGIGTHTIFLFAETDAYRSNLGTAQARVAYPIRSLYASGIPLALSSDRPATAWNDADDVFVSVQAAVRRLAHDESDIGQDEAVTLPQALLLYTGRARQLADLGAVGVIAPGTAADFVVLDRDVFAVSDDEIATVHVAETWIAGERVWAAASSLTSVESTSPSTNQHSDAARER